MHPFSDPCTILTTMMSFSSSMKEKFIRDVCGGSSPSWQLQLRVEDVGFSKVKGLEDGIHSLRV